MTLTTDARNPLTLRNTFTVVWAVLVLATVVSWFFGNDHGIDDHSVVTTLVLVIAFVKARLVGMHFMELRFAPPALRIAFEVWCVASCLLLLGFYHFD
jgi:caa(3)-type oxidase subunit IV